jgi:hypothetical protein
VTDDIKAFLEGFTSKDTLSADLAGMELEDHDADSRPPIRETYMKQLVRGCSLD